MFIITFQMVHKQFRTEARYYQGEAPTNCGMGLSIIHTYQVYGAYGMMIRVNRMLMDWPLVSTSVEQWKETNTFYLNIGSTITIQASQDWANVLGVLTPCDVLHRSYLRLLSWLKTYLGAGPTNDTIERICFNIMHEHFYRHYLDTCFCPTNQVVRFNCLHFLHRLIFSTRVQSLSAVCLCCCTASFGQSY